MKKRIVSVLLLLVILSGLLPISALAESVTTGFPGFQTTDENTSTVIYVNPLYEGIVTEEEIAEYADSLDFAYPRFGPYDSYMTADEAAEYVRTSMESRQVNITVSYYVFGSVSSPSGYLMEKALAETGVPTQGDYLRWVYGGYRANITTSSFLNTTAYIITYTISYYTTAEQESQVIQKLDDVISGFGFTASTPAYTKAKTIYDYICDNVEYDYTHLNDTSYKLQFTTYAALMQGTAVCQGYSTLMYRMCLMTGLPCRIVTGGGHAWNIVKVDGLYYYADSTWDDILCSRKYFLMGRNDFTDHSFDSQYVSAEFLAEYPHADTKYMKNDVHTHAWDSGRRTAEPTCTEPGTLLYTCSCGATRTEQIPALGHSYDDSDCCVRCGFCRGVCISETSFPDTLFRNWVLKECDKDSDGYLSHDEIECVEGLDASNSGFKSLKGIEYFTDLTWLDCSVNYLSQLDVSALKKLYWLDCSYNYLTELDISRNTGLEQLYCANNLIAYLDLSKNTRITDCSISPQQLFDVPAYVCRNGKYMIRLDALISPGDISDVTGVSAGGLNREAKIIILDSISNTVTYTCKTGKSGVTLNVELYMVSGGDAPRFTDAEGHWAFESIMYVVDRGIMTGTGEYTFDPEGTVTRAMVAVILYNLAGEPATSGKNPFTDVPNTWYTEPIIWAYENGIVSGAGDGKFDPNGELTREQFAVMMANYAEYCGVNISVNYDLNRFADKNKVSWWAVDCVKWACSVGIINGSEEGGKLLLNPQGNAKRCQLAVIFQNYCEIFGI